jgi:hypothetical protein
VPGCAAWWIWGVSGGTFSNMQNCVYSKPAELSFGYPYSRDQDGAFVAASAVSALVDMPLLGKNAEMAPDDMDGTYGRRLSMT